MDDPSRVPPDDNEVLPKFIQRDPHSIIEWLFEGIVNEKALLDETSPFKAAADNMGSLTGCMAMLGGSIVLFNTANQNGFLIFIAIVWFCWSLLHLAIGSTQSALLQVLFVAKATGIKLGNRFLYRWRWWLVVPVVIFTFGLAGGTFILAAKVVAIALK